MRTYYISVDTQGQTEIIVKVRASSIKAATSKACKALVNSRHELGTLDKKDVKFYVEDGVTIIDENGDEI